MTARPRYLVALFLALYAWGCVHYPEPDTCEDGTAPSEWCGCLPPVIGPDDIGGDC